MMLRWFLTGSMLLALAAAPPRAAAGPLGMTGTDVTSPDGVAYTLYTGKVASFDGVPLDVDLTVPQGPISPRPLLVMMHGWGGSKTDWESPTVHNTSPDQDGYNNVAFVARGYAVLNYTARGFHGSCGPEAGSDPACAKGWTHLADRRFEIRDTKYLVGLLADAGVAVPGRIGVTGGSYGGGQSWLLALEGDRVSVADAADPEQVTLQSWTSPGGVPLHLAAAVPKYPWSDLIHSLQPNGRASDGVISARRRPPAAVRHHEGVLGLGALRARRRHGPLRARRRGPDRGPRRLVRRGAGGRAVPRRQPGDRRGGPPAHDVEVPLLPGRPHRRRRRGSRRGSGARRAGLDGLALPRGRGERAREQVEARRWSVAGERHRRRRRPCDRPEQGERLAADQRRCQRLPGPLRAPREQDAAGQHLLRTRYDLRRDGGRALQGRELDGPGPRPPAPRRRRRVAGDDLGGRRPAGRSRDRPGRERGNVHHAGAGPVVGSRHVGLPGGRQRRPARCAGGDLRAHAVGDRRRGEHAPLGCRARRDPNARDARRLPPRRRVGSDDRRLSALGQRLGLPRRPHDPARSGPERCAVPAS